MKNVVGGQTTWCVVVTMLLGLGFAAAQQQQNFPWMNKSLSPDERAEMVLKQMTLDEKISLLHGTGMARESQWQTPLTYLSNGGGGLLGWGGSSGLTPAGECGRGA